MKFLFLAQSDSASSGHMLALSLQAVGHEARDYAAGLHSFGYLEQMTPYIPDDDVLEELVDWCDCVTVVQSQLPDQMFLKGGGRYWLEKIKPKPIVMTHGGSHYRSDPAFFAAFYGPYTNATICYEADLMGWFDNEHLILPPVNLRWFQPRRRFGRMRVGHFPSNPANKGTREIVPALAPYEHRVNTVQVSWPRQLDRGADCDVLVDQIEPRIGEWVTWSTEIAALGCIPIANSHNTKPYVETYGRLPGVHICNDIGELRLELDRLDGLSRAALNDEKRQARAWIEECHTLDVTGRILMDKVYGPLL